MFELFVHFVLDGEVITRERVYFCTLGGDRLEREVTADDLRQDFPYDGCGPFRFKTLKDCQEGANWYASQAVIMRPHIANYLSADEYRATYYGACHQTKAIS